MFKKKKSLGQNFLKSKSVVSHIISASKIKKGDFVVEVGPGQGFLTEDLIESSGNVLSIEKDTRLIDELNEKFKEYVDKKELAISHEDILKFNIEKLNVWNPAFDAEARKNNKNFNYKVVANIPYYITGQIIRKFLTAKNKPDLMTIMVQKEVAQRVCAKDGKESLISLSVKLFGEPKYIKTVKKTFFNPPPKVDSAILLIDKIKESPFKNKDQEVLFFEIIRTAFNQKRKKVSTSLRKNIVELKRSGIDLDKRPEDVKLEEWVKFVEQV